MNTIEIKIKHKVNNWDNFYKLARKQFIEYEQLEGRDWKNYDFSIDCAEDQLLFKDMLQVRFIEELTEASVAFKAGEKEHFYEEITDALNFLLSAYIMINYQFKNGVNPDNYLYDKFVEQRFDYLDELDIHHFFYVLVEDVGKVCNLLKNRPWAQSNYLVSILDLNKELNNLWMDFWMVMTSMGLSRDKLFELFERKFEVNKWRIHTGY